MKWCQQLVYDKHGETNFKLDNPENNLSGMENGS